MKEIKGTYEGKLSTMREDIYKKEREVYDLKNQINLINLRLTKEGESKLNTEDALRKNNDRFTTDTEKYSSSLKNVSKDHETLTTKLSDTEKNVYNETVFKKELESKLHSKTLELEDARRKFSDENEEKSRKIGHLNTELKTLQERFNDQNVKNSLLDSKNQDFQSN